MAQFGAARLRHVLGDWASGWHDGQEANGVRHQPCGSDALGGAGIETNIGADGLYWIHQLSSASGAEASYQQFQDALRQCQGYPTRTVITAEGHAVFTARGDRDVWAVRHDDWVVVTYLPRAPTPPPDAVSVAMGSTMDDVIEDALASYRNVDN
jgi:hypothetical protein